MDKRLRLEAQRAQEQVGTPPPGTEVKIAVDLSRSKWVYCVRWQGAERRRLSTGGEIKHLQALVRRYAGCPVHLAFEACGFGYELAWWAQRIDSSSVTSLRFAKIFCTASWRQCTASWRRVHARAPARLWLRPQVRVSPD